MPKSTANTGEPGPRKSYLVTGGHGFIGSALVRALVHRGAQVRTFDNESRGSKGRLADVADNIEVLIGDIRSSEAVARAVEGVDCVIHLAYINGTEFFYSRPELVLEVALKGIANVIDACLKHKVGELSLASSSEVYQTAPIIPTDERAPLMVPDVLNPRYSYGGGKIISELMAINFGRKYFQRVTIFRPHNVYGPDMGTEHVVPQLALRIAELAETAEGPIRLQVHGSGRESRAFVYIDDFVDGALRVIEHGEHLGIYHVGTEDEITIEELVKKMGKYFRRQVQIIPGDPDAGATLRRCPDVTKLRALGYQPKVSLEQGLAKTLAWYCENSKRRTVQFQSHS